MEIQNNKSSEKFKTGRILSGIILILVGSLFFARKLGVPFPDWLFTWPMFFVTLGFYIGAKHHFRSPGWLFLVGLGLILFTERFYPGIRIQEFFWPIVLIAIGAFVIMKPYKGKHKWAKDRYHGFEAGAGGYGCMGVSETNENKIEINAIMGGVKKIVLSKEFTGGEINCIMGGAEVNFTQADIQGKVFLEINNIMGGTKLIIPANWEVRSEVTVVLGGVEDKRPFSGQMQKTDEKILVIEGSCVFGGIDIRSY